MTKDRVLAAIALVGLAIFAFMDLWISQNIASFDSAFGIFFRDFGEYPGYVLILLSLIFQIKHTKKSWLKVTIVVLLPAVLYALYIRYRNLNWTDFLILFVLTTVVLLPFSRLKMSREEWEKTSGKVIAMALILPLAMVQILKLLWGRIRFRDLGADYSGFTPWYLPQGYTGNFSFPSGHAAMAIYLLSMNLYFKNKYVYWTTMLWAILVALSRIRIGAHYASDVWVSFFAGLFLYQRFSRSSSPIITEL